MIYQQMICLFNRSHKIEKESRKIYFISIPSEKTFIPDLRYFKFLTYIAEEEG